MTLGPLGGEHQAEVDDAREGATSAASAAMVGWKMVRLHTWAILRGVLGAGGEGAHAAGVEALVMVQGRL